MPAFKFFGVSAHPRLRFVSCILSRPYSPLLAEVRVGLLVLCDPPILCRAVAV